MKSIFINVMGGTGLQISLASFISYIKSNGDKNGNKDYEFNVMSPYFDIFLACESVDNVYQPNEVKDFIFDAKAKDATIVTTRLYDLSDFIFKRLNYSEAWAKLCDIPFEDTKEGTKVTSVLNPYKAFPNLKQPVENIKDQIRQKGFKDYAIMQFTGGQSPLVQVPTNQQGQPDWSKVPYDYQNEPLKRHWPIDKVQEFVDLYSKANPKTAIIMYQLPNEPIPTGDNIVTATMPYLAYYELAKDSKEIVCIDSSLMHLTAGLTKATVIWAHSLPGNFGYSYNHNIIQDCRRDDLLYFTALGPSGAKVKYIEPEELMNAVKEK